MGENQVIKRALAKLDIAVKKKFQGEVKNYSSHRDKSNNYTLELDVGTAAHVSCMIRTENKMMIIRSESTPEGMSQQDLDELGNEIIEKIGAKKTSYDGVLAIMKAVTFKNLQDEDAEKLIFNEIMAFIQNLIIYKNRLQGQPEDGETEGMFAGDEEENDPFGFNSILTDEEGNPFDDTDDSDTSKEDSPEENKSEENEKEGSDVPAAEPEKVRKEPKSLNNPDIIQTLDTIAGKNDEDKKLSEMLKDFKKEGPLDLDPVDIKNLVPVTQVVDVAEQEIPDDVDIFQTVDAFHGSDQYGLVERTREYKDAAQTALGQIHDILASLYSPVYKLSLDLYNRNDQLLLNERNVQQTLNNLSARQAQIDKQESQILEQQQALLRDRANFNQYRESIRDILNDYDIKCRIVNEQADELRKLRYSLSGQMGRADQLQRQLDAMMSGHTEKSVSREYAEAILKANEKLQEQMEKLKGRLDQCYQIIDAFQACQENWNEREEEYKKLIYDLGDSTILSDTAKEEIEKAQDRIRELEVAVANQTQLAEQQSAQAQEQRSRADDLELNEKELKVKLQENEQKKEELEKRAKTAEKQLADEQLKYDVKQNAIKIRDQLKTIGVEVEAVPGEGEMIFQASLNGCQIVVNVGISVIYIDKELKKPQKYKTQVEALNKQDIKTSYTIGDKYINCRTMYTDADEVAVQVEEIIENMNSFR